MRKARVNIVSRILWMLSLLGAVGAVGAVGAATARAPDPMLSLSCPVCHGNGRGAQQSLPRLQDLSPARIEQRLRGYRDGSLQGTAMPRLAAPLSDDDIAALARHYGEAEP